MCRAAGRRAESALWLLSAARTCHRRLPCSCPQQRMAGTWLSAFTAYLPLLCPPLPAATEDYDFVFAENGLVAYREGKLLAVQSLRKQLGEATLKVRDSSLAHLPQTIVSALCWTQWAHAAHFVHPLAILVKGALLDAGGQAASDSLGNTSLKMSRSNSRMMGIGCLLATSFAWSLVACCRLPPKSGRDQLQVTQMLCTESVLCVQQCPAAKWSP